MHTLMKNWWLLALAGVLEAAYAAANLFMQSPDGSLTLRTFAVRSTMLLVGTLALAAGTCTIAAGLWTSPRKSWLLVLHGLAFCALGWLLRFWTGPLAFRTIAALIVVMALSAGIFELAAHKWLLSLAGATSVGFALVFLAMAFLWIRPQTAESSFVWMGSYFGFSALCLLALALRRTLLAV